MRAADPGAGGEASNPALGNILIVRTFFFLLLSSLELSDTKVYAYCTHRFRAKSGQLEGLSPASHPLVATGLYVPKPLDSGPSATIPDSDL